MARCAQEGLEGGREVGAFGVPEVGVPLASEGGDKPLDHGHDPDDLRERVLCGVDQIVGVEGSGLGLRTPGGVVGGGAVWCSP